MNCSSCDKNILHQLMKLNIIILIYVYLYLQMQNHFMKKCLLNNLLKYKYHFCDKCKSYGNDCQYNIMLNGKLLCKNNKKYECSKIDLINYKKICKECFISIKDKCNEIFDNEC